MSANQSPPDIYELCQDYDTRRLSFGHQFLVPSGQTTPPLPDLERVLTVEIPVSYSRRRSNGHLQLVPKPIDTANFRGHFRRDHLEQDWRLQRALSHTFPLNGPACRASSRQLIDVDSPLTTDLLDDTDDRDALDDLATTLDHHERDPTTDLSHANLLLRHDTQSQEARKIQSQLLYLPTKPESALSGYLMQSKYYAEVAAIVAERRETGASRYRDRLDRYRRVQDQAGTYTTVLEIVQWLRDRGYSWDTLTDWLEIGRYVTPSYWLAAGLHDVARGIPLEDVISGSDGSYWDRSGYTLDEARSKVADNRQQVIQDLYQRTWRTPFETIRIKPDAVVREWYAVDPPRPFPLAVIRHYLVVRELLHATQRSYGQSLVLDETHNITHPRTGEVIHGMRFQDPRADVSQPFRRAMDGAISPDQLHQAFKTKQDEEALITIVQNVVGQVLKRFDVDDSDALGNWVLQGRSMFEAIRKGV